MRRRDFLSVVAGATAWPLAARAQQPSMPVVGYLASETPAINPDAAHLLDAFRLGLAEAGYVCRDSFDEIINLFCKQTGALEGKNVRFEVAYANFKPELLLPAARDLVRLNVDVIFAPG